MKTLANGFREVIHTELRNNANVIGISVCALRLVSANIKLHVNDHYAFFT